ncbi:MAG: YceI family protein [Gammaproteobacteria bacterium]|nr:YceI family protein [Gammaproteobacteria bacterium]
MTLISTSMLVSASEVEEYQVDRSHAHFGFEIEHFGYSRVVGRFNDLNGKLMIDDANLERSTITLSIESASIDTNHARRDEILRGEDFFDVEKFPQISFKSRQIKMSDEKSGQIQGDLTLLGVTRPVTFDFKLKKVAPFPLPGYHNVLTRGFHVSGSIKRSQFGMDIFLAGGAIGDEVVIDIKFDAVKCVGEATKAPSCRF